MAKEELSGIINGCRRACRMFGQLVMHADAWTELAEVLKAPFVGEIPALLGANRIDVADVGIIEENAVVILFFKEVEASLYTSSSIIVFFESKIFLS